MSGCEIKREREREKKNSKVIWWLTCEIGGSDSRGLRAGGVTSESV